VTGLVTGLFVRRGLSLAFGVVMIVATEPQPHRLAAWTAGLAIAAVLFGVRFRSVATLAVLLTALTLAASAPPPLLVVTSGLCATAYLVLRHTGVPNSATPTRASVLAALSFGLVGAIVAVLPLDVAWLPLLAPFGLLGAFAIATQPYLRQS
jgi:hypothetical protein